MRQIQFIIIKSVLFICLILSGCKKNEPLPDLDKGNELNPSSDVDLISFDSVKIVGPSPFYGVRMYFKLNTSILNGLNTTIKKVNVYRNDFYRGQFNITQRYYFDNNMLNGTYNYVYKFVTEDGRETRGSAPLKVVF